MNIYKFCGKNLKVEKRNPGKFNKVLVVKANNKEEAERLLRDSLEDPCNEFQTFCLTDSKKDLESSGVVDQYYLNNGVFV